MAEALRPRSRREYDPVFVRQRSEHESRLTDQQIKVERAEISREWIEVLLDMRQEGVFSKEHVVDILDREATRREEAGLQLAMQYFEESRTDRLTGLPNRRTFESHLEQLMQRANITGQGFGLLIFDVDNFKLVNDTHGHPAGDAVLQRVATRTVDNVNQSRITMPTEDQPFATSTDYDLAARIGGEEYAVLISDTNRPDSIINTGQRIRFAVSLASPQVDNRLIPTTISIGATNYRPGESVKELLDRCDARLYEAKQTGKNKVVGPKLTQRP